ncbi:DUF4393 domain-containing protein [Enterococcus faecium]|uniref:DUF4393 domain-containing protein n=1 Tax=Enterococcus faecium TaxID=1352 RepID=UPI00397DE9E6
MDPSSFFPILSGMLGGAASAGVFKGPIQTLEDWWYVNFGHTANEKAEMLRTKQNVNIEAYKNQLLKEASSINPENLKEPELKILGPALEASKYYIDDKSLREMFAKLIASSMDRSKNTVVHSSFVELIKQMTPLDAQNLSIIYKYKEVPIMDLTTRANTEANTLINNYRHVFLSNPYCKDLSLNSSSLDNLARLGLIENTYTEWFTESLYEKFYIHPLFSEFDFKNSFERRDQSIALGKSKITAYGRNFCATCL